MAIKWCCGATETATLKNRSFKWREVLSWCMIDFSNSLVLMIIQQVYPPFLQRVAWPQTAEGQNDAADTFAITNIVNAVVNLILAPILGVISDHYYIRVPALAISALVYSVATILLYLVKDATKRNLGVIMFFFINFGFRINESFVSAFLPSLCNDRDMNFVSGLGYCIGFVSGVIVLAIVNLLTPTRMIYHPVLGREVPNVPLMFEDRAVANLIVGIIMLLSMLPPILMMTNGVPKGEKRPKCHARVFRDAFIDLGRTFKDGFTVNKYVTLLLVAYFLFITGVQTGTSQMGLQYSREAGDENPGPNKQGFTMNLLQTGMMVYNLIVAATSLTYGFIARAVGTKPLLIISIIMHSLNCLNSIVWRELATAFGVEDGQKAKYWVWVCMILSAFGLGPTQALLRGAVGILAPPDKKCSVFGIMETFQLIGWIIGQLTGVQLYKHANYRVYFGVALVWYVAAFIVILIIPLRKQEKIVRARMAQFGNATLDEGMLAAKTDGDGAMIEDANVGDMPMSPAVGDDDRALPSNSIDKMSSSTPVSIKADPESSSSSSSVASV